MADELNHAVEFYTAKWTIIKPDGRSTIVERGSLKPIQADRYRGNLDTIHIVAESLSPTHRLRLTDGWESTGSSLVKRLGASVEYVPDASILPTLRAGRHRWRLEEIEQAEEIPAPSPEFRAIRPTPVARRRKESNSQLLMF